MMYVSSVVVDGVVVLIPMNVDGVSGVFVIVPLPGFPLVGVSPFIHNGSLGATI